MFDISRKAAKKAQSREVFLAPLLETIATIFFCLISTFSFAQKQYNVLDWKADVTLNTYLVQLMHKQYDERRIEFQKAIASRARLIEYQQRIKRNFRTLLGPLPKRSPLNAISTGSIQQDGYRIEKIVYESFANHHVTANLYIPAGNKKFPAALLFCGHEDAGKATESYQRTAILFAKNGFVVFVIDPVSQSERYQVVDEKGKPLTRGGTTEHTLLNESCNVFGTSLPAYELLDNIRGLDYLVTRPEVDTSKIGCLGNSGGGMQTIYFSGIESRVKVFAPCSYLENRERVLEISGPADGCAQIPGEGAMHLELDDYLISAAPKPILILAGRYDFINYSGTVLAYQELKKVYSVLKQEEKLKLFTYDDGHGISQPKREAAVRWFRKWFYNDDNEVKELAATILPDTALFATSTGNVNTAFTGEESIVKRNINLIGSMHNRVFESYPSSKAKSDFVLLVTAESKGFIQNKGINFEKLILRVAGDIPVPVLAIHPKGETKKIIIWLNEAGKNKIADSSELIDTYLNEGAMVLLADTRGTGETADKPELNDPKYYNKEYRNAMLAIHTGTSLPALRILDIHILMGYLKEHKLYSQLPVELYASGVNVLPAIKSALFYKNITNVNLYGGISSWRDIIENPTEKNRYSYVMPGGLLYDDIEAIRKYLGSDKVKVIQ